MKDYSKIKVLHVDDFFTMKKILSNGLEIIGFDRKNIQFARNGKEAIELLDIRLVDLLVLDNNMPILNGIDVVRYVRNDMKADTSNMEIMMVSADPATPEFIMEFKELKVKYFLKKPFKIDDLEKQINLIFKNRKK